MKSKLKPLSAWLYPQIGTYFGCSDLVKNMRDTVDNLLTHIQILVLFNPYGHECSLSVTLEHDA